MPGCGPFPDAEHRVVNAPSGLNPDETYVAASLYCGLDDEDLSGSDAGSGPDRRRGAVRAKRSLCGGFIQGDGAIRHRLSQAPPERASARPFSLSAHRSVACLRAGPRRGPSHASESVSRIRRAMDPAGASRLAGISSHESFYRDAMCSVTTMRKRTAKTSPHCSRTATLSCAYRCRWPLSVRQQEWNELPMKLERKNLTLAPDTSAVLSELERTMVASIALMKRLRREKRRSIRSNSPVEHQEAAQ